MFAIHPFLVEAVSWISASKVVLYSFFYLLSLIFYIHYVKEKKARLYVIAIVCFVISFGAKEQAVTLPVCLILLDFILNRNRKDWWLWLEKLPFIFFSLLFGVITMLSQAATGDGVLSNAAQYPLFQRFVFSCYSLTEYFFKSCLPYRLSYLYPFPNPIGSALPLWFLIYPLAVIFIIILFWRFFKIRWVFFGILFFLIHLITVLHLIPISRFVIIADRYAYLGSIGIFFIVSWLFDQLLLSKYSENKNVIIIPFVFYVFTLTLYCNNRVRDWYNTDTIKREVRIILKQRKEFKY